jgi:cytochrome bd ubiquinol oxidase subunit II
METVWFAVVAVMIAIYVVLDGFDLGAGAVHYIVGRDQKQRGLIIGAVGPVWDGNEVWLLAAGGTLYFAFPVLYAAAFSGFYLPLMMVLWLLILRATGIELRHHVDDPMWRAFWDFLFAGASILLAVFFGAALGNVIRGVPLNAEGYFFEPLWTTFTVTDNPGILDWYTVLCGVVALVALALHGAAYLAGKTEDEMQSRARKIVGTFWYLLVLITLLSFFATFYIRPNIMGNFYKYPVGWLIPAAVGAALFGIKYFNSKESDWKAFFSSVLYLVGMLVGAVFAVYPNVLPAMNSAYSLTISNASAGAYGLQVGIVWWSIGIVIAAGYFIFLYKTFSGKVKPEAH